MNIESEAQNYRDAEDCPIELAVLKREWSRFKTLSTELFGKLDAVETERDALRATVAALEADRARLNWLEANKADTDYYNDQTWSVEMGYTAACLGSGPTLRAAIDSAIAATQPKP